MNRKGFTLVELLATIVIITIIGGIAIISYTSYIKSSHDRVFTSYQDSMHAEAAYYLSRNSSLIPKNNDTVRLMLEELGMDTFVNPDDNSDICANSYVDVTRSDVNGVISLTYNVCMKCSSGFDNCREYEN